MTRVWACLYNQLRFRSRGDTDVVKCVSIATQRHEEEVSVRCCLDGHKNLSFSFPADVWSERTAPSGRKVGRQNNRTDQNVTSAVCFTDIQA